ncbi:MAG: glycoside hydrolase family 36 protein, partial [bacterium]
MKTSFNRFKSAVAATALMMTLLLAGGAGAAPAAVTERDGVLHIPGARAEVRYNLKTGTFDLFLANGDAVILNARAEASVTVSGEKTLLTPAGAKNLKWTSVKIKDALGAGVETTVILHGGGRQPDFRHIFRIYENKPYFVISAAVIDKLDTPIGVERLSPVIVDAKSGGGVFLGKDPKSVYMLENGHKNQFDFWVRLARVSGGSDSNWSGAAYDTASGRALIGGFLKQSASLGSILAGYDAAAAPADPRTGRLGLTSYHAKATLSPMRRVNQGETLESDPFFVCPVWEAPPAALAALEAFGDAAALANGITPYKRGTPTLWDTWYSRYYDGISEDIVFKNVDSVAAKLKPYGMDTFELDAGWERSRGDWFPNEKFPNGMKVIADRIHAKGLRSAIWFAPFMAEGEAPVIRQHPDWFLELDTIGKAVLPKNAKALDISNPEVKVWIADTVRRITRDWGFKMLKVDFTYYSLSGKKYYERGRTRAEIFREAYGIIREAAGPDVYILAVGVPVAYHVGLVDGMRTGLDNSPRWGTESGYAAQGTLPSYRAMIR